MSDPEDQDAPSVPVGTLAKLFNLTDIRVQQLAKAGIVSKTERGKYDLWESVRGYIRYLQERSGTKGPAMSEDGEVIADDYGTHRARLYKARADAAELDAQLLRGRLHDADAIREAVGDMIGNARAKLLPLGTALCGQLRNLRTEAEIKERIDEKVREALNELADYDPGKIASKPVQADQPKVETPAEADDQPMG